MRKSIAVLAFVPCTICRAVYDAGVAIGFAVKMEWRALTRILKA